MYKHCISNTLICHMKSILVAVRMPTIKVYFAEDLSYEEKQLILAYFISHPDVNYICICYSIGECVKKIREGEEWIIYHNPALVKIFDCMYGDRTNESSEYKILKSDEGFKEMKIFSYAHFAALEFNIDNDNDIIILGLGVFSRIIDKCKSSKIKSQIIY